MMKQLRKLKAILAPPVFFTFCLCKAQDAAPERAAPNKKKRTPCKQGSPFMSPCSSRKRHGERISLSGSQGNTKKKKRS